jgi:GTP-binding protein
MPIVVVNKVDKPNCDPDLAHEAVFDLMFHLGANERQLDFPVVFGSSKQGWMAADWREPAEDVSFLLDTIIDHIPPPKVEEGTLQMMITSLDYSSYTGRIVVGRILRGSIAQGMNVSLGKRDGTILTSKIKELYVFEGLAKERIKHEVKAGEIVAVLGPENFDIGDTIADFENPEFLEPITVDEPTISMLFTINNSPFYGREGTLVTSRHLRDRLFLETEKNLALRVEETGSPDSYLVYGRGILHLSILIETMRREGYELQVGQPRVVIKEIDGVKCEPMEALTVNAPKETSGKVIELVTARRGEIVSITTKSDRIHMEFTMPSRSLMGLRNLVLTVTEGEAVMAHRLKGFEPWRGEIGIRRNGALISMETGPAIAYSLDKLQDRGTFFIEPFEQVYTGQIIGENTRQEDIVVNVGIKKKLTNMRASGSDEKMNISPPKKHSLEEAMEYLGEDEYLEITPKSLRLRKILLNENDRKRAAR